jgi:hypothetical protein
VVFRHTEFLKKNETCRKISPNEKKSVAIRHIRAASAQKTSPGLLHRQEIR